jgi:UDP-N-acetyl-D-galactosamine dehydrogenase
MIFDKLDIDTTEVLNAAGTKWNFHKFTPGLVGGHCIGVDPYYLTHKAQSVGYEPKVILSGRKINDEMGQYIADRFVLELNRRKEQVKGTNCLILGLTFKENCPDLRNTGVLNVIRALEGYGINPVVVDPWADEAEARKLYQIDLVDIENLREKKFDHAIVTVAHQEFIDRASDLRELVSDGIIFDIKSALPRKMVNIRL